MRPPPPTCVTRASAASRSSEPGSIPLGSYGGTDTDAARNGGLGTVNVLEGMETFGFNFTRDGLDRLVQIRWRDQPKQLDDDGNADSHGSVHLDDGFSLDFTENDAIFDRTRSGS